MSFPEGLTPAQLLYPDLETELASTRRIVALVPEGKNDWKPHDKSMALGQLATHLVELPSFVTTILTTEELDFATTPWAPTVINDTPGRLAHFDKVSAEIKQQIATATWEALARKWILRAGPQIYVNDQKSTLIRGFGLSHMAHHRAQLGVFLRLLGIPIPGTYGPSADEM